MQNHPVQLSDVQYNASNQSFEALVTIHASAGPRKYACAINAPISMSYQDAASGLAKQALRRHAGRRGLASRIKIHTAQQRLARQLANAALKADPISLLRRLAA